MCKIDRAARFVRQTTKAAFLLLAAAAANATPSFQVLEPILFDPVDNAFTDISISADGRTIGGRQLFASLRPRNRPRLDLGGRGPVDPFSAPPGERFDQFGDLTADGSVVVGSVLQQGSDSLSEGARWENGVLTRLGSLGIGGADGVSADGSIVAATNLSLSNPEALRLEGGVVTGLGDLPGGDFVSFSTAISANGSIIVGAGTSASGREAFRWESGVMIGLGDFAGGSFSSRATSISDDGSTIVGFGTTGTGQHAFRWQSGVMEDLLTPAGLTSSEALDTTADGSTVVGAAGGANPEAFIWDAILGIRLLGPELESVYGIDLQGWTLREASGISPDGKRIVGWATIPQEFGPHMVAPFLVMLPEPSTAALLGLGLAAIAGASRARRTLDRARS